MKNLLQHPRLNVHVYQNNEIIVNMLPVGLNEVIIICNYCGPHVCLHLESDDRNEGWGVYI